MSFKIRPAGTADAISLVRLAEQLGYITTVPELAKRMQYILCESDQQIWVAEVKGRVQGWLHGVIRFSLISPAYAQVIGMVVDENHRSQGIGAALLKEAIQWGRARNVAKIRVLSNIIRTDAHRFYESHGFELIKEERVYEIKFK